jgi:hypothetical protein
LAGFGLPWPVAGTVSGTAYVTLQRPAKWR